MGRINKHMPNQTHILESLVADYVKDSQKFWEGNNAAGSRTRKHLLSIIKFAKEDRKNVQNEKNNRKAK